MNPLESQLEYPFADRLPQPAGRIEVAPGVNWLRMPLPFALDHINVWLLRDRYEGREGWTLIDCGVASAAIRELWEQVFADGLDGLPVVRVLCTHMHPDHVGLADEITRRFDAPLWMSLGEYAMARVLASIRPETDGDAQMAHFARHGIFEAATREALRERGRKYYRSLVPALPPWVRRIHPDEPVRIGERSFRVVIGTGHSPEHVALYSEDGGQALLVSGDMVLPRISTNVSVFEIEPEANPLEWYLASLRRFAGCAADTLVLPSHGRPFRRLHVRLAQQFTHHEERLAAALDACRDAPRTAAEVVPAIFRRHFDTHELTFALGESIAHLHALWHRGDLARTIGADGAIRFARP